MELRERPPPPPQKCRHREIMWAGILTCQLSKNSASVEILVIWEAPSPPHFVQLSRARSPDARRSWSACFSDTSLVTSTVTNTPTSPKPIHRTPFLFESLPLPLLLAPYPQRRLPRKTLPKVIFDFTIQHMNFSTDGLDALTRREDAQPSGVHYTHEVCSQNIGVLCIASVFSQRLVRLCCTAFTGPYKAPLKGSHSTLHTQISTTDLPSLCFHFLRIAIANDVSLRNFSFKYITSRKPTALV